MSVLMILAGTLLAIEGLDKDSMLLFLAGVLLAISGAL